VGTFLRHSVCHRRFLVLLLIYFLRGKLRHKAEVAVCGGFINGGGSVWDG